MATMQDLIEKNHEYWKKRFEALDDATFRDAGKHIDDIRDSFEYACREIDKEIERFYSQYADEHGISLADAQTYLRANERKEFQADVREYIKMAASNDDGRFSDLLDSLSTRARITRLEALRAKAAMYINDAYGKEDKELHSACKEALTSNYLRVAYEIQNGVGKYEPFQQIDKKSIERILSKPWTPDNKTFKYRAWTNKEQLIHTLSQVFTRGFISGIDAKEMTKTVKDRFGVAEYAAARLVNTEAAYFASEGSRQSYEALGLKKYQILATLDDRTCDICADLDGQVFDMDDYEVGLTAPPFHPNCRTTTIPYIDDPVLTANEERAARDPDTGKTVMVDGSLTYSEWKDQFVTDDDDDDEGDEE